MSERSDGLPDEAWQEITVAQGTQGPRSYLFSAQRVRPTSKRKPGEIHWAVYRRNRDASEPRYYLSNAPEDTPLETLARVGDSRWHIETEFETTKSGRGDGRVRDPDLGWLASSHRPVPAGRCFPVEPASGLGGKCPGSPGPRSTGSCVKCCPESGSGPGNCWNGWRRPNSATNEPAAHTKSAAPSADHHGTFRLEPSL